MTNFEKLETLRNIISAKTSCLLFCSNGVPYTVYCERELHSGTFYHRWSVEPVKSEFLKLHCMKSPLNIYIPEGGFEIVVDNTVVV